jgi:hypothetical protein
VPSRTAVVFLFGDIDPPRGIDALGGVRVPRRSLFPTTAVFDTGPWLCSLAAPVGRSAAQGGRLPEMATEAPLFGEMPMSLEGISATSGAAGVGTPFWGTGLIDSVSGVDREGKGDVVETPVKAAVPDIVMSFMSSSSSSSSSSSATLSAEASAIAESICC